MSVNTATNRFITTSLTGFYQQLLASRLGFKEIADRLIKIAENAHAFREFDKVREVGELLSNLPLQEYRNIGHFYIALSMCRNGLGDMEKAIVILERLADALPMQYRAKAMLLLAAINGAKRNPEQELYFFTESLKINPFNLQALRGIAVLKAKEGYHPRALKELEQLYPLARFASPNIYFDYMNSLAVELGEAGRKEEARGIINHVIASPFAPAYPEWRETAKELKPSKRSFIRVPEIKSQPVEIEPTEDEERASEPDQPAAIVSFPKLKEADPPKKPDRVTPQELSEMTRGEKRELILAAVRSDAIRESEYNKLIFMFGLLDRGPGVNILDLEDETVLDDVMIDWANLVPPEELASVLSALRDCEDDRRRNDLIDRMIRKAFEQSRICGLTESEWRHKVESKLP